MKTIFKFLAPLFLATSIALASSTFIISDQPAFASMGSTGGGSTGSGGGGGGGGSSSSGSDSSSSSDSFGPIDIIALIFLFIYGTIKGTEGIRLSSHLKRHYHSAYLAKFGLNPKVTPAFGLFTPNTTIKNFERLLYKLNIKLDNPDGDLDTNFTEVYAQAQYLYSQILREKYVNHRYSPKDLKKYLDKNYYKVMTKEIKLKVSKGTIDETVINKVNVVKYAKLDENLIIVKLDVIGQDREVQFNKNFENSFERNRWSDYVIFGKNKHGQYKIINLIYGEHFHLNGKDFNHQAGLSKYKYKEKKI